MEEKKEVQLSLDESPESMSAQPSADGSGEAKPEKIGTMVMGLVYEGDWKANSKTAGKGENKTCKLSRKYMPFLLLLKETLKPHMHKSLYAVTDECMRMNVLYGAKTLAHTDAFKGSTPNFLYIVHKDKQVLDGWCVMSSLSSSPRW